MSIPGQPRWRRRGCALTGWRRPPRIVVRSLDADPESQASWWARALARQCRDALDELTFLAPWTLLPASPDKLSEFPGIGEIPTLRELASLEVELLPAIEHRLGSGGNARGKRLA